MDNRNDLQWRPEDWEHTLGHLRKAERLLMLKTWGVGTAVAGTVVTAAAVYFQPEPLPKAEEVKDRVETVESVQPVEAATSANAAEPLTTWADALEAAEALEASPNGLSEVPAETLATLALANAESTVPVPTAPNRVANRADVLPGSFGSNAPVRQAPWTAEADVSVELGSGLTLLDRLAPGHFAHSEIPQFYQAPKELSNVVVADRKVPPLRLSALPIQKGIALESPVTVGWAGPVRMELTPGLSVASAPVQWAAWHPGEVFGSPMVSRQVHSNLAIRSHAILSSMMALSPVLEVGTAVGVQYELTRRMDYGVWNADANAWSEVIESNVWGRVEEANPWSVLAGLRLDYAVAPEWKVVAQFGWTVASDLARKQPAIDVSNSSPAWIQIGIQR